MGVFVVPTSITNPAYSERLTLDGVTFSLRFRFNTRVGCWLVDISDENGEMIVSGRRLVCDWPILRQHGHLAVPAGQIMAFDTTERKIDPVIDDLGDRVLALYFDAEEIAAL